MPRPTILIEEVIRPSGSRRETMWLVAAATCVLTICTLLILITSRQTAEKDLPEYKINAFSELSPSELAVFNGLYTSAPEINDIHNERDGKWMSIAELEEYYMPPFVRDRAWEKNGRIKWTLKTRPTGEMDIALYTGNPQDDNAGGTFILLFLHNHKKQGNAEDAPEHPEYEIWYTPSPGAYTPEITTDQAFISAGWKEVVAYKGSDEKTRIKGE